MPISCFRMTPKIITSVYSEKHVFSCLWSFPLKLFVWHRLGVCTPACWNDQALFSVLLFPLQAAAWSLCPHSYPSIATVTKLFCLWALWGLTAFVSVSPDRQFEKRKSSIHKANQYALGPIKSNPKSKNVVNMVIIRERLCQDTSGFSTEIRGIY